MNQLDRVRIAVAVHLNVVVDRALGGRERDERGDVPGWVMVTMMTALLVAALTDLAGVEFSRLFQSAVGKVSN